MSTKPGRLRRWWKKELQPLLITAVVVFAIRSSLADWNDVPTGSMKPTIQEGDRVFVNKLAYDLKVPFTTWHIAQWDNPSCGDIVVFFSPYDGKRLVKRVIGLPGDTIELRQNRLLLNGVASEYEPVPEVSLPDLSPVERSQTILASEQLLGRAHWVASIPKVPAKRDFGPFKVPEKAYFVMGDNRDNSFDSRYYGVVSRDRIVGRATTIVLSLDPNHYYLPRWHRTLAALDPKP